MVQSVELLLDDALQAAVRAQWRSLAEAGLPSLGRRTDATNRPHVTLAVSTQPWPDPVERALATAVAGGVPVPIRLGGVLLFPHGRRCVLARAVVPSAALLGLHARLAGTLHDVPGAVPHLAPGAWTPHVTLARAIEVTQLPTALARLGPGDQSGAGVSVRRWDGDGRREWPIG